MNWETLLSYEVHDPNLSMNKFYENLVYLLDEMAPYKKLSTKELKLKLKPWITNEIQEEIFKRDKLLKKSVKSKDDSKRNVLYNAYKKKRNEVTNLKRISKKEYYTKYFEKFKNKTSSIWKGIRSLVQINSNSRRDIE